jgi:hypothetical protein
MSATTDEKAIIEAVKSYNDWYRIEPRLAEYEAKAWKIAAKAGMPTTWPEFGDAIQALRDDGKQPGNEVIVARNIIFDALAVRDMIKAGNAEHAALEMMILCNRAFTLDILIDIEPILRRDENQKKRASESGKKSGEARRIEHHDRNHDICKLAKKLIYEGTDPREIRGIIAKIKKLTPKQIGNILNDAGLTPKKLKELSKKIVKKR